LPDLTVEVPPEAAGERLDRFLAGLEEVGSRAAAERLLSQGGVRVNGSSEPKSHRLAAGDVLEVRVPERRPSELEPEQLDLRIAYEDEHLLVVDKPAGMVVHPAAGHDSGTLVNALLHHITDLSGVGGELRPGIVHRLDRGTSGLMVVAKNDAAHQHLARQFAARSVERVYLALVWGLPSPMEGTISGAIGRDPRDRKRMALVEGRGKPAQTRYAVLRAYGVAAALLSCRLLTGRTHQIRVHLASIGHPLIGDATYGRVTQARLKRLPESAEGPVRAFPRQALHAAVLGFEHPSSGQRLRFETEPPADMRQILNTLESLQKLGYT